ncbi:alkylation response protein AidB-like acyl-CoA dehydrogenase [Microbacterium trichothecenolyticum]|uniref:acyl-CoA dehydrogenase family protein n=1 Tax=Microbacterium trichothecenolyticum TaxID=69370 RepID=UPI0028664AAE|nr:acyl-CoA dehydrogenase family protein [Microbacterium trichothecenolyticum]MDR7112263.1 alkylation response protein AidB-like acyl-CoA dehydrogenase [Microbacterium trichothecenolyticum]
MGASLDTSSELAGELLSLTADICARSLSPHASAAEQAERFPREQFRTLGGAGLLSLPYPEEYGGAALPAELYLQVFEQLGRTWASVAVGVSVHALACLPMAAFGTEDQKRLWLPWMLSGDTLGAYCLSEAHAGSDPAAMRTRATPADGGFVIDGAKAWTTHGGEADFYTVMARTSPDPRSGISCFLVLADSVGLSASPPERKLGLTASTTATVNFDGVFVPEDRVIGGIGDGLRIALAALDTGRLGIAAIATGLAQAALEEAVRYARDREAFGQPIIRHEGVGFMLADMAATVETGRAMYLTAARRRDMGLPFTREASIAKLVATDGAMAVTMNAVQVLGGAGYTKDFPVERYMREAKVMQIFEGTNQIQRLIIARDLERAVS